MRLEPPLSNLMSRCMTICEAECCGFDAFDLNPIHIASYLLMYRGAVDHDEVARIRKQLDSLKTNYGTAGAGGRGATFEDLNQHSSASDIDSFVDRLLSGLDTALSLVESVPPSAGTRKPHRA